VRVFDRGHASTDLRELLLQTLHVARGYRVRASTKVISYKKGRRARARRPYLQSSSDQTVVPFSRQLPSAYTARTVATYGTGQTIARI
jgi:hypothetical protein